MNHFVVGGLAPYALPLPYDQFDVPYDADGSRIATVAIGKQSAQGPVLCRHWDGRVTIDAGGHQVTGREVGQSDPPSRDGWFFRLLGWT